MPKAVTHLAIRGKNGRAVTNVPPQTVDLTPGTAAINDMNPFWSKDEQFIVFQSDRAFDAVTGTLLPAPGPLTHLYRMSTTGANITPLTGPNAANAVVKTFTSNSSQTEPAYNVGTSAIVYVDRGIAGADLVELNLVTHTVTSLLKNNPQAINFNDLNHPEYTNAPGGNVAVVFGGQLSAGGPFHIYTVQTVGQQIVPLTSGAADDRNPTLSPDPAKPLLAFDSNRADASGATSKSSRDIWVMNTDPQKPDYKQVTNSPVANTNNIEPAWSTFKQDLPTGFQQIINGQQVLAFSTTRVDSNNDGIANAVGASHDIYFILSTIGVDPASPGSLTVLTPEAVDSPAAKLGTDDPTHVYDDRRPTFPQFISTYRVAYHSNRSAFDAGSSFSTPSVANDIFSSNLIDTDAPSLIRWDEVTGEVVNVSPRVAAPGSNITISVKIADYGAGVRDVWAQIKNPESKYQASDGKEHKTFVPYRWNFDNDPNRFILTPLMEEYESEPIFIGDGTDVRFNTYPRPPLRSWLAVPPIYDSAFASDFAFSGLAHPPTNTTTPAKDPGWLQLVYVAGSRDPLTGVGTYRGVWRSDIQASDYYLDIIAYDKAANPFTPTSGGFNGADAGNNMRIYDNVWGFTTKPFNPSRNILFVSDYACGQKFFFSRFGNVILADSYFPVRGTESWLTDTDIDSSTTLEFHQYQASVNPQVIKPAQETFPNALGFGSYTDGYTYDGTGTPAPQRYDIWRILCRGAVPDSILQQYAPRIDQQPADTIFGEVPGTARNVVVAQKCVIWHAPFAGDVFTGPGTITDLAVQQQLHNFLMTGGRLVVNGQDVAWALSLNGSTTNAFLTGDMKSQFLNEYFANNGAGIQANPASTTGFQPIANDPWTNAGHYRDPNHGNPLKLDDLHIQGRGIWDLGYCSHTNIYPDSVSASQGAISDFLYAGGGSAVLHYSDTITGQRMVFTPCGMEGITSDFYFWPLPDPAQNPMVVSKSRRAILMHNIVCWLRTGTINGNVSDLNNAGKPIPGALVRLFHNLPANTGSLAADYTALTDSNGNYVVYGVNPDFYTAVVSKAGFTLQRFSGTAVHGGFQASIAGVKLITAEPANISGKITSSDGTTGLPNVTVTATDVTNSALTYTAVSDASGNYTIQRIPSGTKYTITVTLPTGYSSAIPASRTAPDPLDPIATQIETDGVLHPSKTYTGFDFKLIAPPGSITGFVKDESVSPMAPIAGATVSATQGTLILTAITGADGSYSFNAANTTPNGLDPGNWSLTAIAPGYGATKIPIVALVVTGKNTVASDILLSPVPPGSLAGLVTRSSDNTPLANVTITIKDLNGKVVATTVTGTVFTSLNNTQANYKIDPLLAGVTYTVTATASGFTANPLSQSVPIVSGVRAEGINFSMEPLHTFIADLSLVSSPYDYITGNAGDLLAVPQADRNNKSFLFATWELGKYIFYPTAPADTFRLGRGYFLSYKTALPLSAQGTALPDGAVKDITLNTGWNLIGDPYLAEIDWNKVQVVDLGLTKNMTQAVTDGAIGSALYGYAAGTYTVNYTLSPWQGYWVRAFRNVTLHIDPNVATIRSITSGSGSSTRALSRTLLGDGEGWLLSLHANAGSSKDYGNIIGVSSRAIDGYDRFKSQKPPIMGEKYIYVSVDHGDWADMSGSYGLDVRSTSASTKTWNVSVLTSVANTRGVISWPEVATLNRNVALSITDLATGEVRDMRTNSSYSWQTGDGTSSRRFRIESTRADRNMLRISDVVARSATRGGSQGISFNLSSPATVDVRILNASGQTVRQLNGRGARTAGISQITWDGKSDNGTNLSIGLYMVEIRAQSTDGRQTVRASTPVVLVR